MYAYNAFDKMNSQNFFMWISSISYYNLRQDLAHVPVRKPNRYRAKPINSTLYCCNADLQKKKKNFPEMLRNMQCSTLKFLTREHSAHHCNQAIATLQSFQLHQSAFTFCLSLLWRKSWAPKDKLSIKTILTTWHSAAR